MTAERPLDSADEVFDALTVEWGHYRYESGHHGDVWLELDDLLADEPRLARWCAGLAERARSFGAEVVCGPETGGALVARHVAAALGARACGVERHADGVGGARYALGADAGEALTGARVLVVDDAVNAGSALLATVGQVRAAGGELVASAALVALGESSLELAAATDVPFVSAVSIGRGLWTPEDCPLCDAAVALEDRVPRR